MVIQSPSLQTIAAIKKARLAAGFFIFVQIHDPHVPEQVQLQHHF